MNTKDMIFKENIVLFLSEEITETEMIKQCMEYTRHKFKKKIFNYAMKYCNCIQEEVYSDIVTLIIAFLRSHVKDCREPIGYYNAMISNMLKKPPIWWISDSSVDDENEVIIVESKERVEARCEVRELINFLKSLKYGELLMYKSAGHTLAECSEKYKISIACAKNRIDKTISIVKARFPNYS